MLNRFFVVILLSFGLLNPKSPAQSGPALPTLPLGVPLDWFRFDDTNWLTVFGSAPLSFTNLDLVPDWDDNALQVDSTNAAWLQYRVVETNNHTNLAVTFGSVRFWFLPNWSSTNQGGSGPGVWSRLIEAGVYTTNAAYGWWSLYLDPAGDNLFFSAQTNTGITSNYIALPISWDSTWHQITLTYSITNTQLYLDGVLATNGPGLSIWPGPDVLTNGFFIGSDYTGIAQAHGQFDDLWTFNYPLDAATISNNYNYFAPLANPSVGGFHSDGFGSFSPSGSGSPDTTYGSNVLWLAILPPGTNDFTTNANATNVTVILVNTIADIAYDLFSATNLTGTNVNWTLEQTVLGSELTNYTVTTVPISNRPTLFFKAVAATLDSTGSGLPDYWQLQYFGHLGVDPYGDPAGDGWSNLQKYENGMNPLVSYTPPAPVGLTVNFSTNGNITLSWTPAANLPTNGAGAVTGYTISTPEGTVTVSASQTNYVDDGSEILADWTNYPGDYVGDCSVQVNYASADSLWATQGTLNPAYSMNTQIVRGPQGRIYLLAPNLSQNVKALRVWQGPDNSVNVFDIPAASFTNGIYIFPDSVLVPYLYYEFVIRPVGIDGTLGPAPDYLDAVQWRAFPFLDARRQIQQNVSFLLQAATETSPYDYYLSSGVYGPLSYLQSWPDTHVYSGFDSPTSLSLSVERDEFTPFEYNYFFHNFLFSTNDLNSNGSLGTGAYFLSSSAIGIAASESSEYLFDEWAFIGSGSTNAPAPILTNWLWTYFPPQFGLYRIGIAENTSVSPPQFSLGNNQSNWFGLAYQSAERAYFTNGALHLDTLYAGGSPLTDLTNAYFFYPSVAAPELATVNYYFGRPDVDPLPGDSAFAVTNTTPPVMFASVGQPFNLTAWAKQAILNGDPAKFAYPEQYFDQAYTVGTNGVATTNSTGILSPYGEFFPTQPGPTALVTMPDIDTGLRATNIIQVISMNADANHDGTVDTSFFGADNTSADRPFKFWANNDYDRLEFDADDDTNYEDSVLVAGCPYTPNQDTKDNNYRDASGRRVIPTKRDLQDFTRLWLAGITTNLLTNLPSGSTITLSWGDVGSPNTNNPVIDLFAAAEANGGIGYLTNETVASQQTNIALCPYIGRLGPGSSIQLNASTFSNHWAGNYFIWCGAAYGSGALTLTIADASSNVLAQTVAYIQIVDIKQMYERWTVGDAPTIVPTTNAIPAVEDLPPFTQAFQYPYDPATDANTPYILFVHGWNMTRNDKDRFAESAFKRLYWQGYQGRFGLFRWPTDNGFKGTLSQLFSDSTQKDNYDRSEYQAWQSAAGLRNKLNDLNAKYPGHVYMLAHSMGNVVAGEALRLSGSSQVVNTYVASQGAVSAHTYDTNVPNYSFSYPPFSSSADTPNIYGGWFAGNNGNGAGRVINFYNTNDYALARGHWQLDQLFKPDQAVLESGVNWYYNYSGSTNDPPPWNNFYKQNSDGSTVIGFNIVTSLNNRYEVMAFDAQSYTTALGATPGVGHIAANVNITTLWPSPDPLGNNYGSHFYHSAEFRGDTAPEWNYWHLLLTSPTTGFNISTP